MLGEHQCQHTEREIPNEFTTCPGLAEISVPVGSQNVMSLQTIPGPLIFKCQWDPSCTGWRTCPAPRHVDQWTMSIILWVCSCGYNFLGSVPSLARPPTRWAVKDSQSHGPTPLAPSRRPTARWAKSAGTRRCSTDCPISRRWTTGQAIHCDNPLQRMRFW